MTDQQLLNEVQVELLEPPSLGLDWPSGLWTSAEMLGYLQQREARFLKESGLIVSRASLVVGPNDVVVPLPADWVATVRCCWLEGDPPTRHLLTRGSQWELDQATPRWSALEGERRPHLWTDSEDHGQLLRLMPTPSMMGLVEIAYVALPASVDGNGQTLTTPDDFCLYVRCGILADALGKRGRGQDLHRAQYFEERFAEGVVVARAVIGGLA